MSTRWLTRPLGSDRSLARVAQAATLGVGVLLLVIGMRRLPTLGLTEPQLLLGVGVLFSLLLQCGVLYVLLDPKRRSA